MLAPRNLFSPCAVFHWNFLHWNFFDPGIFEPENRARITFAQRAWRYRRPVIMRYPPPGFPALMADRGTRRDALAVSRKSDGVSRRVRNSVCFGALGAGASL